MRHIIIKLSKDKEKMLKVTKEEWLIKYVESSVRLTANFSSETLGAKRERVDIFKVLGKKKLSTENSIFGRAGH